MLHLVPQARISRNLGLYAVSTPKPMPPRRLAARADAACDFYLRVPHSGHAPSAPPAEYVHFARAVCTERPASAPALADAASQTQASSMLATLTAVQAIGLASAVGSVLGGHAASEAAKRLKKHADVTDQIALALPGAIVGGLTGLALAGRQLAVVMPSIVRIG